MWQWGPADTIYIYMYIYNIGKSRDLCIYICTYVDTLAPYMGTVLGI